MIKRRALFSHSVILLLGSFSCGLLALWLGQDVSWDLRNYHYYIPYAFLHNRYNIDFLPAGIQTYLNPFLDILNYYLLKNFKPIHTEFILGTLQGINCYLMFILTKQLLDRIISKYQYIFFLLIAIASVYSANFVSEIGTMFNDLIINEFILMSLIGFLYLYKKNYLGYRKQFLLFVTILLGAGVGFKVAFAPYAIGFVVGLFFIDRNYKSNFYLVFYASLGVLIGFLITNGYWMYFLWERTGNPFFPFLNKIFKSEYAGSFDVMYGHLPKSILQAITFPYFNSTNLGNIVAQVPYKDYRYFTLYILLILLLIKYLYIKVKNLLTRLRSEHARSEVLTLKISAYPPYKFLLTFCIISYLLWEIFFSVERYLIPISLLCPILIIIIMFELIPNKKILFIASASILVCLMATMHLMNWGRTTISSESFFNVNLPKFVDLNHPGAVLIQDRPTSFIVPSLPSTWSAVLISDRDYFSKKMEAKLESIISSTINNNRNLYLVALPKANLQPFIGTLDKYHLEIDRDCGYITGVIGGLLICKVKKAPIILDSKHNENKVYSAMNRIGLQPVSLKETNFSSSTRTSIGLVKNGELQTTGRSGCLLYGPYALMEKGKYHLTIYGTAAQTSNAWVEVTNKGVTKAKFNVLNRAKNNVLVSENLELEEPAVSLEVRIFVGAKDVVNVKGYELLKKMD